MTGQAKAVEIFYCYANADEELRHELEKHLMSLQRQGLVTQWYDRKITAGAERSQTIDMHLKTATIILLLISPDFLASDCCYDIEMQRALERNAQNEACVIPIILRPCDWQNALFAHLQILPQNAQPVTSWTNPDEAFAEIAKGIRAAIEQFPSVSAQPQLVSVVSGTSATARKRVPLSRVSSIEQQNREHLIRRVRSFWIKGVFEQSLHHAALMRLGLQETPDAVENPWRLVIQESEHASTPVPAGTRITEVYDDAGEELLILGEPGSGKTTLLLELAHDLLKRSEQEPTHPIPVVFNLSSWTRKRQPLASWLIEELETKYQVPRKVGSDWINADQILPLLDGLDEVDASSRFACMQMINEYHQAHNLVPLVVCCRVNEYMALASRLALFRAVTIQPLTTEQINEYFARVGEQIASLRIAFQNDLVLQELATTPLMLTVLILAYEGSSVEEIKGSVSAEVRRQQIFATYTQRMLRRRSARSRYSSERTIHWLGYLAQRMKQQSLTVFYIERMQPTWLLKKWQRRFYHSLITGPICGLFVEVAFPYLDNLWPFWFTLLMTTLIMGWLFGWVSEPVPEKEGTKAISCLRIHIQRSLATILESRVMFGIMGGSLIGIGVALYGYQLEYPDWSLRTSNTLSSGLSYGIFTGLFLGLAIKLERRIEPVEALNWSWRGVRRNIVRWLLIGLGIGLVVGVISALPLKRDVWLGYGLASALLTAFQFILFVMLTSGVIPGLSKRTLDAQHMVTPNQGIWRSARHGAVMAIITGAITAVFLGAITFLTLYLAPAAFIGSIPTALPGFCPSAGQGCLTWVAALFEVLTGAAALGLTAGLYCGGAAYVQHFVLRFLLWYTRSVPFNYSCFLDYAAERILLRKVGGGYIFIHRLLLEHFASLEEKPNPSKSGA
jgi:hypothetical protein